MSSEKRSIVFLRSAKNNNPYKTRGSAAQLRVRKIIGSNAQAEESKMRWLTLPKLKTLRLPSSCQYPTSIVSGQIHTFNQFPPPQSHS